MSTQTIHIRQADPADLPPILAMWETMMRDHEAADGRVQLADGAVGAYRSYLGYHLNASESRVLVGEPQDQSELVAFCLTTISRNLPMFMPPRYGYLSDLYVKPAWRRQGIGRRLVRMTYDWLRHEGIDTVQLQYYNFNGPGGEFWRSLGFEPYYQRMWVSL